MCCSIVGKRRASRCCVTMPEPPSLLRAHAASVPWTLLVLLLLLLPTTMGALAVNGNPMQDLVKNVFRRRGVQPQQDKKGNINIIMDLDRGLAVLRQLNLTSSTEPRPFYARPQQLPSLFTASMVVRYLCFMLLVFSSFDYRRDSLSIQRRHPCLT